MVDILRDFWFYMRERKKWILIPVIVILLLMGILIVLSSGSALAPWIYSIF
ncbi:hypothetical protein ES703_39512 [subsurface metagenome]